MTRRTTVKKTDNRAKFKPKVPWTTPRNQYENPLLEARFKRMKPGTRFTIAEAQTSDKYKRGTVAEFFSYQPRKKIVSVFLEWTSDTDSFKAIRVLSLKEIAALLV